LADQRAQADRDLDGDAEAAGVDVRRQHHPPRSAGLLAVRNEGHQAAMVSVSTNTSGGGTIGVFFSVSLAFSMAKSSVICHLGTVPVTLQSAPPTKRKPTSSTVSPSPFFILSAKW